jgi:hypothetical protein
MAKVIGHEPVHIPHWKHACIFSESGILDTSSMNALSIWSEVIFRKTPAVVLFLLWVEGTFSFMLLGKLL